MKKQFISLLLAATIATSSACAFTDVGGHWAESSIDVAASEGIVNGYADDTFRPNAGITRAEFAKILCRVFDWRITSANTYADLPEGAWYTSDLLRVAAAGVMTGSDGRMRPNDVITRQEAATCLSRALRLRPTSARPDYVDVDDIADWALSDVAVLTRFGFMCGRTDGRFAPLEPLTRAEAAKLVAGIVRPSDDGSVESVDTPPADEQPQPGPGPDSLNPKPTEPEKPYIMYAGERLSILENLPKSTKDDAKFVRDARGRMTYPGASLGVDVSAWQGEIDWQAVANDGFDVAMIRAGYRGYTEGGLNVDAYFERNLAGAKAAGLDVGVYFYSQAITPDEAVAEAKLVLELLDGAQLDKPIVFDWELPASKTARTRGISRDMLTSCAKAFCDTVADAEYQPMVYFYLSLGYREYWLNELADYPFWLAQYSELPSFYYDVAAWQYTDKGEVNGIVDGVDMNLWFD